MMGEHGMEKKCNPVWSSTILVLGELGSVSNLRDGSSYQVKIKWCPKAGLDLHRNLQDQVMLPASQGVMEEHTVSLWLTTSRFLHFPVHVHREE